MALAGYDFFYKRYLDKQEKKTIAALDFYFNCKCFHKTGIFCIFVKIEKLPEICRFYGIIIKMFFNEHNPPHFHAEYQDYKAVITIEDGIVEGTMPKRALNLIFEWLDLHKDELLENWNLIKDFGELKKINPLN